MGSRLPYVTTQRTVALSCTSTESKQQKTRNDRKGTVDQRKGGGHTDKVHQISAYKRFNAHACGKGAVDGGHGGGVVVGRGHICHGQRQRCHLSAAMPIPVVMRYTTRCLFLQGKPTTTLLLTSTVRRFQNLAHLPPVISHQNCAGHVFRHFCKTKGAHNYDELTVVLSHVLHQEGHDSIDDSNG